MRAFAIVSLALFAVVAAKEGNVEKRGVQSGYPAVAVAAAPVVAKAAAYAAPQYAAIAPAYAYAPAAYAAPAFAAYAHQQPAYQYAPAPQPHYGAYSYAQPAYAQPQYAAVAPAAVAPVLKSSGPQQYSQQIPAAAIRNVETVGVTKTITPVVTKTTTYNTHSEPALSVGHVQGYSQQAHGAPKVAPVQYTTAYTQYLNPTVGSNGPVTYAGPALSQGVAIQQGAVAVQGAQPVAYAQPAAYAGIAAQPAAFGYSGLGAPFAGQAIGYGGFAGFAAAPQLAFAAAPQVAYQAAPQIAYAQQPQYYAAAPVQAAPAASYGTPAAGHAKGY